MNQNSKSLSPCGLCGRVLQRGLTAHHLIPRTCHSNKWFKKNFTRVQMQQTVGLCRDCHKAVHRFESEKSLGRDYNTVEALLAHPQISSFVEWAKKQK